MQNGVPLCYRVPMPLTAIPPAAEPRQDGHDRVALRRPLTLFAVAVLTAAVSPLLLTVSRFLDGVLYAAMARNMAEGVGDLWHPHWIGAAGRVYHEQPPLAIWIASHLYRVAGDIPGLDPLWSLVQTIGLMLLLAVIWCRTTAMAPPVAAQAGAWWPILLFAALPLTQWMARSHMLESTMALFVAGAILAALIGVRAKNPISGWGWGAAGGAMVTLAVLSKGPAGAFPLAVPLIAAATLERRRFAHALGVTLAMLAGAAAAAGVLVVRDPEAMAFVRQYLDQQVLARFEGRRVAGGSHFHLLKVLAGEMGVAAGIALAAGLVLRRWPLRQEGPALIAGGGVPLFFLVVGLAGTLPILLSDKQSRWYLFPALPFFVLAFAALTAPIAHRIELRLAGHARRVALAAAALLLLAGAVTGIRAGTPVRHREFVAAFVYGNLALPPRAMVTACPESLSRDWQLVADLQRYRRASLVAAPDQPFLLARGDACTVPPTCSAHAASGPYRIYRCAP